MKFPAKLTMLRTRAGLSQGDLAPAVAVHQSRISKWENDEGEPSISQGLRLARALGVPYEYLADDAQDEPPAGPDPALRKILDIVDAIGVEDAYLRLVKFGVATVAPEMPRPPLPPGR